MSNGSGYMTDSFSCVPTDQGRLDAAEARLRRIDDEAVVGDGAAPGHAASDRATGARRTLSVRSTPSNTSVCSPKSDAGRTRFSICPNFDGLTS